MIVCKKKRCVWRVYCGEGKYYCHKAGDCPNVVKVKDALPNVKWAGLVNNSLYIKYYASKRNKKGNSE